MAEGEAVAFLLQESSLLSNKDSSAETTFVLGYYVYIFFSVIMRQLVSKTRIPLLSWEEADKEETPSTGLLFPDFRW